MNQIKVRANPSTHRYMTIDEARKLECNGCGDCCGTEDNTEASMGWGQLPKHQYKERNNNKPLIVPLDEKTLKPRPWKFTDNVLGHHKVLFKCAAFCPQADGTGSCGIHSDSPDRCREFPVFSKNDEERTQKEGEYLCGGNLFPRCTWHGVMVVDEDHPLLELRQEDGLINMEDITPEYKNRYKRWANKYIHFRGKLTN